MPAGSEMQSFVLELILTAILMFVILGISTGDAEKGITAGIVVGSVIGLEAMFAGPICGGSMNPARSLAPALVSGHIEHLWLYLVAPIIGACFGVLACCCVRETGCCSGVKKVSNEWLEPWFSEVRSRKSEVRLTQCQKGSKRSASGGPSQGNRGQRTAIRGQFRPRLGGEKPQMIPPRREYRSSLSSPSRVGSEVSVIHLIPQRFEKC